jgi:two-component system, OmpR family, sensor kinase
MASLRARLVAGLLALAAAGLLLLGGITYAEQRSFLYDRLDQQVRAAPGAVLHQMHDHGLIADQSRGEHGGPDFGDAGGHGPPPGGGGGPGAGLPPPGTYGEYRPVNGRAVHTILDYGQSDVTAKPDLPATVPVNRLFTVGGRDGDETRYRVLAQRQPDGDTIIAAVPLHEVDQTLHRLLLVLGLVLAGVLIVLGVGAALVVRVGLLPLDRMAHTAGAIAGGDLSHRVETTDPRTEVGRLGLALNRMLDRLERAFAERRASEDRLRQFIADASHELRTPLASIRGYAELHRMGAAREEADTEKAMRRIEDESRRMGVLVEDLLTLARLDEVPDADRERVDLTALAHDAVDDARATAPRRPIELATDGAGDVLGDPHQLRQVLANLLRNALVHTPDGTQIDVSVRAAGGDVALEVRDHGPGLPTDRPGELFERFWRAEGGRERGKAGAGLGLAIVAGIVDAHGGSVEAANAPGGGARFVVRLPACPR